MDFQLLTFINHFGHGTRLDTFSQAISRNGTMIILRAILISLTLFFKKKYRKFVLLSFVLAAGFFYLVAEIGFKTILIQEIGIRPRPYITHADMIQPLGKPYSDSSFPSSHITLTVAMITVLIILFPSIRPYAILYALLMAWSRMFNGMHYPSDILAGSLLGIGCGRAGVALSKKVFLHK